MRSLNKVGILSLVFLVGLSPVANGEGGTGAAVKAALKSKAAIKFYELIGTYLMGKALDSIYESATQPDPKQLDKALGSFQKDHPEYTVMLGTLRRAVKTDGSPTSREEFERLAQDLVFQMDHSQLSVTKAPEPSLQWNPSGGLLGQQYGLNRLSAAEMVRSSSGLLRDRPTDSLGLRSFPPSSVPLLSLVKEESVLAAKLVGAWSFSHAKNPGAGADVYIFHRNGKVTQYKVFERDEIFTFNGTYSVDGKKLNIRWELPNGSADTLSAMIEEVDGGHVKYTPEKGLFDLDEPVAKTLTRISDVGHFSVVTLSNPTDATLVFQIRWATVDGFWSPWDSITFEPGSMWSIPHQGGFFCQISFDSSFEDDRQEKTYELPFNVVASTSDPKLLDEGGYRIRLEGGKIDLVGEKLSASKPLPGVR